MKGISGKMSSGLTLPKTALITCAVGFKARTTSSVVRNSSSVAKSDLFRRTTSAFSTCSASNWPTVSKLSCCTPSSLRAQARRLSNQSL
eukprot:CAMPEP_0183464072 /NCGR_PEP_ID=MMETSP0370-20130417/144730_1 /TAXON_ID=268820 /ORGANISM="Peridinium aciculiferum, Strain PAER-2" /LENGTH=88 /DNA_ID=CAMNT_0025656211 /DNA_START=46 /DNA_END=309 /DNA_ORIENTATION=-